MNGLVFGARDLRALCSTGPRVSFRAVSTYPDGMPIHGLFDRPIQMKLMDSGIGGIESAKPELRLPFNTFNPMPEDGDTVVVEGTGYTVSTPTAEDDGAFLVYELYRQ
ncbi:MAG TPA: hypothetical protein VLI45_09235 [Acidobacteriaceae bacterium]|nr:hypothetical protein [Acidobacteriaceae bacterium]